MKMELEDIEHRRMVIEEYKPDVERLVRYLPWLEQKAGGSVSQNFTDSGIGENSIPFPVYDSTLLSFIKEVQRTTLLDRNYQYIYSRNRIKTPADEQRAIAQADITRMDVLKGILSKYVMGGMTKSKLWSDAVKDCIFLNCVKKMKENVEFWDKPLA